uniref:PH domain-containing protein n=1 Tax=Aegilops tauschii subsp. strangulata TaxID=200361 RepID=A0A453TBC4_AEGTS
PIRCSRSMSGPGQKTFKILCRADEGYCVTVRGGDDGDAAVVMAAADPDDEYQHWYKDMRRSTRVKDEEGYPAFALVNKATGLAIKHSLGQSHPVDLVPYEYDPAVMDLSVLWTQSRDVGDGFRCIRMVSNIYLNFDAFEGEPEVRDGTVVGLWEWNEGGNQCWKILPWGTQAEADGEGATVACLLRCLPSARYACSAAPAERSTASPRGTVPCAWFLLTPATTCSTG